MADKQLKVTIVGDATKARKALQDLDGSLAKTEQTTTSFGRTAAKWLAGAGIAKLVTGSLSEGAESIKVAHQTEAVIRSTGEAAHVTAAQVSEMATSISNATGLDDEWIQSGANLLLTFKNIRNEAGRGNDIFSQTTKIMADMAVATGSDAKSAALQLGKALNDPISGVSKLARVGVTFTEQQKEQIRTMVESGNVMGAQKLILAELSSEFGGSAAAQATGLDRMRTQLKNMEETLGTALMPAIDAASRVLSVFADVLNRIPGPIVAVGSVVLGAGAAWNLFGGFITGTVATVQAWVVSAGEIVSGATVSTAAVEGLAAALTEEAAAASAGAGANAAGAAASRGWAASAGGLATKLGLAAAAMYAVGKAGGFMSDKIDKHLRGNVESSRALAASWVEAGKAGKQIDVSRLGNDMLALQSKTSGATGSVASFLGTVGHIGTLGQMSSDVDNLAHRIDQYDKGLVALIQGGHVQQVKTLHDQMVQSLEAGGVSASQVKKGFNDYTAAMQQATIQAGPAKAATDATSGSLDTQKKKLEDARKALDDLSNALKGYSDNQTSLLSGEIAVQGAIANLTSSLAQNGNQWDVHDASGRANLSTLLAVKDAMVQNAQALIDQGAPLDMVEGKWATMVGQLEQTMTNAGMSQGAIQSLITQMGLTPAQINTFFQTNAPAAMAEAMNLKAVFDSMPREVSIAIQTTMYGATGDFWGAKPPGHAWGGRLGPGWSLVGEQGPELTDGRRVIGAGRTQALADRLANAPAAPAQAGTTVVNHVTVNVAGSVRADRDLTQTIARELVRMQRRSVSPILPGVA